MNDRSPRRAYVVQDPYDDDAIEFMRTIETGFGLRAICLHSSRKGRFYGERQYPELRGALIETSIDLEDRTLDDICSDLRDRYDIVGLVPFREDKIQQAVELVGLLGVEWNDPVTLGRFRDKLALKRYVQATDTSVRVPVGRVVADVGDVFGGEVPARFVIKPNDGTGNHAIGVFWAGEREAVVEHLAAHPGEVWLMEEFIEGPEFHVDGQVRSDGSVTVLAVFEYLRVEANGSSTVYRGERQCGTDHPRFAELVAYAEALMTTTGLRRCPFHLEAKVDEAGPCLIDLGARLPSEGGGYQLSQLHPSRPSAYRVAAQDYLFENDFATEPIDWTYYDSVRIAIAYGISSETEIIETLTGVDEVSSMPEFWRFSVLPRVGDRVVPTQELRGAPYIVEFLHHGGDDESDRLIEFAHRTIRWNDDVGFLDAIRGHQVNLLRRIAPRTRWTFHNRIPHRSNSAS